MRRQLPLHALVGLSLASASCAADYPAKSTSNGFKLVVNLTDLTHDYNPSIHKSYVSSIHVGAGLALVGFGDKSVSRTFYQNGTLAEVAAQDASIISDGGSNPVFPQGMQLNPEPGNQFVEYASLNAGNGSRGVGMWPYDENYVTLMPETWAACNESLAYYGGAYFLTLKRAISTINGHIDYHIPENCLAVRLIPECTVLNDLPEGSYSSHEYAQKVECYDNVAAIDWSKYPPPQVYPLPPPEGR